MTNWKEYKSYDEKGEKIWYIGENKRTHKKVSFGWNDIRKTYIVYKIYFKNGEKEVSRIFWKTYDVNNIKRLMEDLFLNKFEKQDDKVNNKINKVINKMEVAKCQEEESQN